MKQKMTTLMMSALALAMSLLSCTNDNDVPGANPGTDAPVSFTAAIGQAAVVPAPASRAADNKWAPGDSIGIFMLPHGAKDFTAVLASNHKHVTPDGDGRFTPAVTDRQIYYPMDDSPVDFIAYYPYITDSDGSANIGSLLFHHLSGVQTTATQAAGDLLWTRATGDGSGYRKSTATGAPVSLAFRHVLAKLTMLCKVDPSVGITPAPGAMTVTIRGMKTTVFLSLQTGSPSADPDSKPITPRQLDVVPSGFHAAYDALIAPFNYTANEVTVDFVLGGETFTWHLDAVPFESGKNHVYDVLITRTGVEATGTIEDWETKQMGEVETE